MSVTVVVQFKALAEKQAAFQTIMETVETDLPKVSGCLGVSVLQDLGDPCQFTLIEIWESQDSHKAHIEKLVADGAWTAIENHLDEQPSSGYFRQM